MAGHERLIQKLAKAGGEHVQEKVPGEALTLDVLVSWCEREERILRFQYPEGKLQPEQEAELARYPLSDLTNALRRWAYLKHLYRVRWEGLTASESGEKGEEAEDAARQLLRREPVSVELSGRVVEVTGRSYSAMLEMAAHEMRITALEAERKELEASATLLTSILEDTPLWQLGDRSTLRAALEQTTDAYARVATEIEHHRRAIYAHALTPDGGPAIDVFEEAPDWWREMTREDDARLIAGLWEAGPGRLKKLGRPPKPKKEGAKLRENFGFASLFRAWEPKMQLPPAALYDSDLGQAVTAARAAAVDYEREED